MSALVTESHSLKLWMRLVMSFTIGVIEVARVSPISRPRMVMLSIKFEMTPSSVFICCSMSPLNFWFETSRNAFSTRLGGAW